MAQKSGKRENKRRVPPRPDPLPESGGRTKARVTTLSYEERPAMPAPRGPFGSAPELIMVDESVGRATLATIEDALRTERLEAAPQRPAASSVPDPAFIFEISTFVVEGEEIFGKASERARREFVAERLLHRLPVLSMDDILRIDITPGAAPNTVILRVWSKVGAPPR